MKPYILMTLYRRYFELTANLKRMRELKNEFKEEPVVYLVWAQPEKEYEEYINKLVEMNDINVVITREKLEQEGEIGGVTYPESFNLRLGMDLIKKESQGNGYIIIQTADCFPYKGVYSQIDKDIIDYNLCIWKWSNEYLKCVATNFFAVCMNEDYWPPVSSRDDPNVLEYQWQDVRNMPKVKENNDKGFFHNHDYNAMVGFLRENR